MNDSSQGLHAPSSPGGRIHALDAVRGFALLIGVGFHAALSFMPDWPPGIWATNDASPSQFLSDAAFVTHIWRMSLFFFIAGFFARLLHQKLGTRGFWANRGLRIGVPLVAGWVVVFPMIAAVWTFGITKALGTTPPPPPAGPPGAFPLTHLWFLYLLLIVYAVTLAARSLFARLDSAGRLRCVIDQVVASGIRTGAAAFTFGIPLAVALFSIPMWFYWAGIPTPDHSLIPEIPASVGFGTAFVVGWLVQRASAAALPAIEKRWFMHLALAASCTCVLMFIMHRHPLAEVGFTKNVYAYLFGVAVWSWVFGLTGAALRFLSNYSPARRYVADASYWVYIMHLPVVAAVQVWVSSWPLHWSLKFPFILAVSFAVLFASYHWLVRPTFIGVLLNGRRVPRKAGAPAPAKEDIPAPAPGGARAAVATLRGAVKRYGAITALDGVDIDVRAGELLAVLGPNGAGKSTAIALWLGLQEADGGEVTLLGGAPQDVARRRGLGVMLQDVELPKELQVRELVRLAASYYDSPMTVEDALRRAGIEHLALRRYGKLSGGQKRQAQFAVAICGRPRVLFLDEPSVGLDVKARQALWTSVRRLVADGCSIVLTTHYLEEAEALADRIVVVTKGRVIASGSVDDMRELVARRQISCISRLSTEEVRAWPGVVDVQQSQERLLLTVTDAEGVVRRLLAADPTLAKLEVRQAGLTEAFTELTREAA